MRLARARALKPRFTDFFTNFEKNRLFCSLLTTDCLYCCNEKIKKIKKCSQNSLSELQGNRIAVFFCVICLFNRLTAIARLNDVSRFILFSNEMLFQKPKFLLILKFNLTFLQLVQQDD